MAAITGAQTDRMTRDDGWRLLSIGRHIERLSFLASSLSRGFDSGSIHTTGGFEAMIALFDSTITFHAQYQQSRELAALIDLLVLDHDNPRSLNWVAHSLRGRLSKLEGLEDQTDSLMAQRVPDPTHVSLAQLCESSETDGQYLGLNQLLQACMSAAFHTSEDISVTYFTHSGQTNYSVGT
jgi:uncharacterized alpha-E superfamily protein